MSYRNFAAVTFTAGLAAVLGCSDGSSFEARTKRYGRLEVHVAPEITPAPAVPVRGQLQLRGIDVEIQRRVSLASGGSEGALELVLPAGAYDVSFEPEATPESDAASTLAATPSANEAGLPRVIVISAQPTRLIVHTRTRLETDDAATHTLDAAALARR